MEILNKTLLKEPKVIGRKPKYTEEYMMMVGRKVCEGEIMGTKCSVPTFPHPVSQVLPIDSKFPRDYLVSNTWFASLK